MLFEDLEPGLVWKHFLAITKIPRPSGKEEKIREYLISFAKERDYIFKQDKVGNLLIEVPATKGCEKCSETIIQGHMDMVAIKTEDSRVDPEKDPLDVYKDGDLINARGTTLGADNGIGIACAISIAEDKSAKHGPLELLFTVAEETAMVGAGSMEKGFYRGKRLLSLDAERFGRIYVGTAGSSINETKLPLGFKDAPSNLECYQIKISRLKGGHSGLDIHKNRANAMKLLAHLLRELQGTLSYEIADLRGGRTDNSIPSDAEAVILFNKSDLGKVEAAVEKQKHFFMREYKSIEDDISIACEPFSERPYKVLSGDSVNKMIGLIFSSPSGVVAMSRDIPNLVETSNNLGIVEIKDGCLTLKGSSRAFLPESLVSLERWLLEVAGLAQAEFSSKFICPSWLPDLESNLFKTAKSVFKDLYRKDPEVLAVHAAGECSVILDKQSGMEAIALGPDIFDAHSTAERVSIESTKKLYEFLKHLLEKLN